MDRLQQQLAFLREIDQFKDIERLIPTQSGRLETDAEHTWHLAMYLMVFDAELPEHLDRHKMLKLALIHDLAEIYAGDIYAFDEQGRVGKQERELEAARQLFGMLPDDLCAEYVALFEEYEHKGSEEARVVKAFDKLQPLMSHLISGGKLYKDKAINREIVEEYNKPHFGENDFLASLNKRLLDLLDENDVFSNEKQLSLDE